ncbi:MAG: sigma factor-like helix-turn-helix DNA-binding protein [Candidatus Paceibacterota bacterium]
MSTTKKQGATLSFQPKQVTKRLLSVLPERARDILICRYGLGKSPIRMTLEAIGTKYGITRERVRQIENYAIQTIRKSKQYEKERKSFTELKNVLKSAGGIVAEHELMELVSRSESIQNHVHFLLVVGEEFTRFKEDERFHHRWHVDSQIAEEIHGALERLYKNLSDDDIIPESEMISRFLEETRNASEKYKNQEIAKRWLGISKQMDRNPLGEWGRAHSPNINAKGMRDYAYLVLRKHGSPIHFEEVAKAIETLFNKKAHVATTHNELIKDARFVLVGRGLYALKDWGYVSGVVKDVIRKILQQNGPLTKDEVIDKVMKERYVKENTILVNLQNPRYFKKRPDGRYENAR